MEGESTDDEGLNRLEKRFTPGPVSHHIHQIDHTAVNAPWYPHISQPHTRHTVPSKTAYAGLAVCASVGATNHGNRGGYAYSTTGTTGASKG